MTIKRGNSSSPLPPEFTCENCGGRLKAKVWDKWTPECEEIFKNSRLKYRPNYEDDGHEDCKRVLDERRREREAAEAREAERRELERRLANARIRLEAFETFTFENFLVEQGDPRKKFFGNHFAFNAMRHWTPSLPGICMMGSTGVGKTHLCLAFVGKQIREGRRPVFWKAGDLMHHMQRMNKPPANGHYDDFEKVKRSEILVLDDLGAYKETDFTTDLLTDLLDFRIAESLPLFVTTNCNLSDLQERLHERASSRLWEVCAVINVDGSDMRKEIQKKSLWTLVDHVSNVSLS